jgi:hypothetical protein
MNIAAIVDNLGPSQKSFYLIKEFNKTLSQNDLCVSVFFKRASVPVIPAMFSCKSVSFLSGYHHTAIATTIDEASILLKSNNNANKFLYLWNLEWLTYPSKYSAITNILRDSRLKIIARSESHEAMIYNFCNKKTVGIVDNWNVSQLLSLTQQDYSNV